MKASVRYRALLILGLVVLGFFFLVPTLFGGVPEWWAAFLPSRQLRLGLDLQGGTHLVLSVDVDKAIELSLDRTAEEVKKELDDAGIGYLDVGRTDERISVTLATAEKRTSFEQLLRERFPSLRVQDSSARDGRPVYHLALLEGEERRLREFAVEQSLETIRNRVDQFGVTEPIIQRQGDQDILIQLPGIQDPERAKALIGRTAVLEFKLVAPEYDTPAGREYIEGKKPLPPDREILYGPVRNEITGTIDRIPYLLEKKTLMTGDVVTDARVRPRSQLEGPSVDLELDGRGARIFDEITAANVGRRLAIVLDGTVYSAPVIKERISGGRANISGAFDIKEARDLAIVLRAGALPAPVYIAEERTVGPTLGRDSIRRGFRSFLVGGLLVMAFMIVYYRFAGFLADMALVLNVFFLLAAMSALGSTLTLPGIAGIVLTLGMAVDANVLINERIREEIRLGKTARAALDAGYERALPAILDSNITTFLSGLILFQFGSGPIRGFAVTLCIGIVSSVFTAVVGTRTVYDYLLAYRRLQTVSI
ncbi:MAG: protein translocase subunit SecD [Candidatus Binatia bacterium]|nr:MAG: protein translocase subunit SecD [Candidatus Binatia bacterium]